ncbi:immunoglobulin-like domain-containing protein [Enterococcus faecium]|uniref:immunoglobulin-like domain-containing protein n=1 Tax=Enterococcus faecium TaxID=1352 RepID=UPI000BEF69C2|nr:immunoglobulin-like domain-containing protein [Enterococcus faecium]PEH49523.1 hypothetical protein CRM75_01850 [Enterococcus faecium]
MEQMDSKKNRKKGWKNFATVGAVTLTLGSQLVNMPTVFADSTQTAGTEQSSTNTQTAGTEQSSTNTQTAGTEQSSTNTQTAGTEQSSTNTQTVGTEQSSANTQTAGVSSDPSNLAKVPDSLKVADTNITTLMLKVTGKESDKEATLSYTPATDATDPYQGGKLTGYAKVPLQGDVFNRYAVDIPGVTDNVAEHIQNYEKGNYGSRLNIAFPKGVDARAMYQTIDWEKSNSTLKSDFFVKVLNIPTPFHLTWGMTWDQSSVRFDSSTPNEFSIMLRGIDKSKVSSTEWNKYDPIATTACLTAAGLVPGGGILANMEGWAEGSLTFDLSKYTGNTDDLSKDKILTKDRLTPTEDRTLEINISALDRDSLSAGTEGAGDISKALVITGHEHDNTQTTSSVDTWSDYLSVWDNEEVYNSNTMEEPEITGTNGALPGQSIVNRDLVTNSGDNFNDFALNRFNRVINYFTKQDVTKGNVGDVDHVDISHLPTKVPIGEKTPVTYSGEVTYYDGTTRQLMKNILNVTNSKEADYALTANDYTIGNDTLTGTYGADVKEVHVYANGEDVGTAKLSDGKYTISGLNGKIKAGDKVTVAVLNDGKKVNEVPVTVKEGSHDYALTANDYTVGNDTLTGTYGADVKEVHVYANGEDVGTAKLSDGKYTISGLNGKIKAGDKVTVAALNDGKKVNEVPVTVKEGSHDYALTANDYTVGNDTLTGTYGADVKEVHVYANGEDVGTAKLSDGKYTISGLNGKIKAGDKVTVAALNDGKKVNEVPVTVKEGSHDYALTVNPYTIGENDITGTFGKDIAYVRLMVNGKIVKQAISNADGTYDLKGIDGLFKKTDDVKVIGTDSGYNQVAQVPLIINDEPDYKLTANDYTMGENDITGTFGKDIAYVRLIVNGKIVKQAVSNTDGTYDLKGINGLFKKTDDVKVIGVDTGYNQVAQITLVIKDNGTKPDYKLTEDDYVMGENDITGTFGKDIAYVRLMVNEKIVKQAILNTDGTYDLKGVNGLFKKTDDVKVIGVDTGYNQVAQITLVIKDNGTKPDYKLTEDDYVMGENDITGTFGKDIAYVRLMVNEKIVKQAISNTDGTYDLKGVNGLFKKTDDIEIIGINSSYKQVVDIPLAIK